MLEWLADGGAWAARRLAVSFLMPSSRDSVLALGSGWLIGLFAFRYYFGREGFSLGGYLRHAFPARVYRSRSFAVDVQVFLFDRLLAPMRWVAKVVSVTLAASTAAPEAPPKKYSTSACSGATVRQSISTARRL